MEGRRAGAPARCFALAVLWCIARPAAAGDGPAAAPVLPGEAMVFKFFEDEVRAIEARSPLAAKSPEEWRTRRLELRAELKEMLGLLPELPRGDLRATVTGMLDREDLGITVEKLHFQPLPGLYTT